MCTPGDHEAAGSAAPGWYPDPGGSGNLFYWDGSRWTGDVHAPTVPAPSDPLARFRELGRGRVLVAAGGGALAISPFLTWVKVILLGDLSLFQLFDAADRGNGWAWGAVVAGIAAVVVALRERSPSTVRGTGLAVGLLGGALAVYALVDLRHELRDAQGLAQVGIGPYVAVAGCLAMAVGGWMAGQGRSSGQSPGRATDGREAP
jgi:Protein of unknown function (DUF2510)